MKKIIFLSVLSLFLFTGCHGVGGGIVVKGGHPGVYHSPPAYAPAYGRGYYRYYYYPNAEIYFDVGRNMYFYLDSVGRWSFSVNLPLHLRSYLHSGYVEIEMEDDRPYLRHKYHRKEYKKRKYKSKYKYHKKKYREKQNRFFNDEDYERREKKNSKKKYREKPNRFLSDEDYERHEKKNSNKKYRKKQNKFMDDEDDDKRHKKGRRYDKD